MYFKKIALCTACGMAALSIAILALPRQVSIEHSTMIDAAPEAVIALADSGLVYQTFNPSKDLDPNLKVDLFGPTSGIGSGFAFESKDGADQQTVASVTDEQVVFDVDFEPLGQPTQANSAIALDGATKVTWSMDMDLSVTPLLRVMGLFMDDMTGPHFEHGLANIADVAA